MPRCLNPRCQTDYPPGTVQCINPFCQCLLPEAVIAGRYCIEALIGMGGMGAVYRVNDTFEEQQVALKVISTISGSSDLPTAIERFRREARYARELHHRNIVPVLNFGQDGHLLYIVMPLITGGTLKSLLKSEKPLPVLRRSVILMTCRPLSTLFMHIHGRLCTGISNRRTCSFIRRMAVWCWPILVLRVRCRRSKP